MNPPDEKKPYDPQLRAAAETQLATTGLAKTPARPRDDLLHELQVHQIELEMQNEALRQAQIALGESRDRYVDLYEFAPAGYLTLTTDGMIAEINLTGTRLLGVERKALLRRRFTSFVVAEDQNRWTQHFVNVKKTGTQDSLELALQRGDGAIFHVQLDCNLHEISADNAAIRIVLSDITARKQVEAERARLDQLLRDKNTELERATVVAEKASLAKSEFLSSMSHELRTPLNAILGFTQLLDAGASPTTPAQKRSIQQILKAGWYLVELINEILDLALIESGKLSLSMEPMSLSAAMLECKMLIEPLAAKRGIRVTFPRLEHPYYVEGDRVRVKQLLINLLTNAIKYNKPDGTVTVDCILSTPGRIRLCVEDTGEGLSAEKLAHLFQPFNRLGQEAGPEEGTGIGLIVCKRLIELMGGVIGAESTMGKGSVFWIELTLTAKPEPVFHPAELAAAAHAPLPDGAPSHTLLYVEDNPANLMLVEELVGRRPDIRFLSAQDGVTGIEMARASQPDIILLDINLPGLSGMQVLEILAAAPATARIPVVALSANAMASDIENGLAAGFFRYLTKPIKINEFMDTLDVALKFAQTTATATTAGAAK
jgi:PAS domain S-box-containing protein